MKSNVTKVRHRPDLSAGLEDVGPVSPEASAARTFLTEMRISGVATLALALVVSGIYPLVVWALAQGLFPYQAEGSLIRHNGAVLGSELIGQSFHSPKYFHPRPSAAGDAGYDAAASGGSNLGPLSKKLLGAVKERAEAYRMENGLAPEALVPADAVTASGSGLDPHISVRNAEIQALRVAHARGIPAQEMARLLAAHTEGRDLGVLGEPRVNVLKLNLALDRL